MAHYCLGLVNRLQCCHPAHDWPTQSAPVAPTCSGIHRWLLTKCCEGVDDLCERWQPAFVDKAPKGKLWKPWAVMRKTPGGCKQTTNTHQALIAFHMSFHVCMGTSTARRWAAVSGAVEPARWRASQVAIDVHWKYLDGAWTLKWRHRYGQWRDDAKTWNMYVQILDFLILLILLRAQIRRLSSLSMPCLLSQVAQ